MAIINALATGNWSSAATWPGGVFPTASDAVYANNKTITIDQNITVQSISNIQAGTGVAGGVFNLNSGFTVNANIIGGATVVLNLAGTAATYTINGDINGSGNFGGVILTGTNNNLTVTGNIYGGSAGANSIGLHIPSASCVAIITGNVTGGTLGQGLYNQNGSSVTITGNIYGSPISGSGNGVSLNNAGSVTVYGNVFGGIATAHGISVTGTNPILTINGDLIPSGSGTSISAALYVNTISTVNITGNVNGGNIASKYGYYCDASAAGTITINGNMIAGTVTPAGYHMLSSVTMTVTVNGSLTASSGANAIFSLNEHDILRSRGPFIGANSTSGRQAAMIANLQLLRTTGAQNYMDVRDHTGSMLVRLSTPDVATNLPFNNDVREGVVFGGTHTGTLAVPNPDQVSAGILTDDTVGTAVLIPSGVWNHLCVDADIPDSMGDRLKKAATVETTGDQIVSI